MVALTPNQIQQAIALLNLRTSESIHSGDVRFHCPFHTDKTPSLSIHMTKGIFKCFSGSCGRTGTISQLYYEIKGTSLRKDLKIPDNQGPLKIQKPEPIDYSARIKNINMQIEGEILELDNAPVEVISYLRKRGISIQTAKNMNMSYMPYGKINGTPMIKRLLIPSYENGKIITYEGRDITNIDKIKVKYPKNCTTQTLFDIDNLDLDETLYVVEGIMDLAVLREDSYFSNSTSTFGATITKRQIELLNETRNLIVISDKDPAGNTMVENLRLKLDRSFQIIRLPNPLKDIGDIPQILHTNVKQMRLDGKLDHIVDSDFWIKPVCIK